MSVSFLPARLVAVATILSVFVPLGPAPVLAQGLEITSIDPADGAFGVPTHDTVTVRFTREVSIENDWNAVVRREPFAAFDSVRLTIGDINTLRTDVIFYEVFQDPNTDFVWLITGMRDGSNNVLAPTVFSYSTASDRGPHQVTGQVSVDQLGKAEYSGREVPRAFWSRASDFVVDMSGAQVSRDEGASMQLWDPLPKLFGFAGSNAQLETPDGVIVFLATRNIFGPLGWAMAAAAVTDATGAFTIPYVRDGTYWPVAMKDLDQRGDPFEALGFYDPDADGQPDPVSVAGGNVSGIDISLFSYEPQTAAGGYNAAVALAAEFATDQRLVWIFAPSVDDDGRGIEWYYNFHSPDDTLFTAVYSQGFYVGAITERAIQQTIDMLTVPDPYVDSDVALTTADANGGDDFASQFPGFFTTHNMKGGNFFWQTPRNLDDIYWEVSYAVRPGGELQEHDVFVDMATGEVIVPANVANEDSPSVGFALSAAYPNPFRDRTEIAFELDAPAEIHLRVFDLLGREVAVLAEGRFSQGRHAATWDATGAPSGMYVFKLDAAAETATGTVMRVR